jgi:hypothetical protein
MDLPMLNTEQSYIGCTTERILKDKANIFDVYIDCDKQITFYTNDSLLQSIIKITRNDRDRFKKPMT